MERLPLPVSVLILAGGRSSRMGQDKAWLELDGKPLVQRVTERILPLASEIIFSTHSLARFDQFALTLPPPVLVVTDHYPGAGPLAGIHAGLMAASHKLILVLAVDMPFVKIPLLRYLASLAHGYDAVVPALPFSPGSKRARKGRGAAGADTQEPRLEPLHAFYWRQCLPAITARLEAGERRVISFFPDVHVRFVLPDEIAPYDPDFASFRNLNTPEDWHAASE